MNYRRNQEVKLLKKLSLSWKKEDAIKGKILLSLIYNDIVQNNETFTLRWRKKWVKFNFLPVSNIPILKSAILRGEEEWQEKLEK